MAMLSIDSSGTGGEGALSLVKVANRPAILRVLDSFAEAGVDEVAVAVEPHLAPDIRDVLESAPGWPFTLSYLHRPTGEGLLDTLSAIGGSEPDRPLLLHWACALFKTPLGALLSGAMVGPLDAVLLTEAPHPESPVVELASGRLAALPARARAGSSGRLAGLALLGAGAPEVARGLRPGRGSDVDVVTLVERMTDLAATYSCSRRATVGATRARPIRRSTSTDFCCLIWFPTRPKSSARGRSSKARCRSIRRQRSSARPSADRWSSARARVSSTPGSGPIRR